MVYLILALILSMGSVYAGPPEPSNGTSSSKESFYSAKEMRKDDLRMVGSNMHYFTLPTGYNTKNINLLAYQGTHSNFVVLFKTNTDFYFLYSQEGHNRALEKVTKEKAKDWVRSNAEEYYDDIWGRKHV